MEEIFQDRMTPEFRRNEIQKIIEKEILIDNVRHENHDIKVHVDEVHVHHINLISEKPVAAENI